MLDSLPGPDEEHDGAFALPAHIATSSELTLHDETIQALVGIGLKIEYCMLLLNDSPQQARDGLDTAITQLDELVSELRARIEHIK